MVIEKLPFTIYHLPFIYMKKLFLAMCAFGLLIATPAFAFADIGLGKVQKTAVTHGGYAAATETTVSELIGSVIETALSLVGAIFLALVFYAGYLWMTAHGEEEQVTKAKRIFQTSITGLVITVGAYSITSFIVPRIVERTTGTGQTTIEQTSNATPLCCKRWTSENPDMSESVASSRTATMVTAKAECIEEGIFFDVEYQCSGADSDNDSKHCHVFEVANQSQCKW
jgi:hypothetical protein